MTECKPLSPEEVKAACKDADPQTKVIILQNIYTIFYFRIFSLLGFSFSTNYVPY